MATMASLRNVFAELVGPGPSPIRRRNTPGATPALHCVHGADSHGARRAVAATGTASAPSPPSAPSGTPTTFLKDLSMPQLEDWVQAAMGSRPQRAKQLWKWLYRDQHWAAGPDDMPGVSASFRQQLAETNASFDSLIYVDCHVSADGTRKVLFQLKDDAVPVGSSRSFVETVLIPHLVRPERSHGDAQGCDASPKTQELRAHARALELQSAQDAMHLGAPSSSRLASADRAQGSGAAQLRSDGVGDGKVGLDSELGHSGADSDAHEWEDDSSSGGEEEEEAGPGGLSLPGRTRYTVCVSSQLGCAMNCQFCFTAKMGLQRSLSTGQMVDQVVQVRRLFSPLLGPINNVVFMGMGEPLANLESVVQAVEVLTHEHGLHCSPNRVTVSTCGLVPEMHEYCRRTRASLALSLHATTDEVRASLFEVRSRIMPVNKRYPIAQLMRCLEEEFGGGCRSRKAAGHVLVEYLLLDGVNDSMDDAQRLCKLTSGFPCKINLIMFNAFPGAQFQPSPVARAHAFQDELLRNGAKAFLRLSRGDDAMAACGQLGNNGLVNMP